jgi:hypothetical protein
MTMPQTSERGFNVPAIDLSTISTMFVAGAIATLGFDAFGQGISPLLGFAALSPVPLAQSALKTVFGLNSAPAAHLLHFFTGLVAYALGWMLIARPLAQRFVPGLPWWLAAVAYGIALWVFALYIMAHLVAGMPAFLGFTGITWVALIGHVTYAVVLASVIEVRRIA